MTNKQAKQRELNAIKSENAKREEMSLDKVMDAFARGLKETAERLEQMSKILAKVAVEAKKAQDEAS